MNDFITETWLRANHTLSEGSEIHLPADARLTPSARELLESRRLRIKFLDPQGRLFVDDDEQQPQPVHGLTSSDTHPQACCELCRQPVVKKPDTLTHLTADKMVAKSDPRLGFRAALDSAIALTVWLQIELAEPRQPWLFDIRSRLGNIMRADAIDEPLAAQSIVGSTRMSCIGFPTSRCAISTTITGCRRPATVAMRRCLISCEPKSAKRKPSPHKCLLPVVLRSCARTFYRR